MRRNILFNNKANEVTLEAVARKEVPYYIRRKLTGSNDSYIQKKRDGRCIGYAIVNDDYYLYEIHTKDEDIAGYKEAERKLVSPYIKRKLKEAGNYIRRNQDVVFSYKLKEEKIYIAEIKLVVDEKEDIYSLMNGKDIYSRLSGVQVVFVKSIVDDHYAIKDGVFCDGLNFIDNIEETIDDISQMVCNFKDMLQVAKLMTHQHDIDDALTDSVLASLVADEEYYFKTSQTNATPVIKFADRNESFYIYKECMNAAISNTEGFYYNFKFDVFILYEVEGNKVKVTTYNGDYGRKTVTEELGSVVTPNGKVVSETSAYGRVKFDIKSILDGSYITKTRDIYCTIKIN